MSRKILKISFFLFQIITHFGTLIQAQFNLPLSTVGFSADPDQFKIGTNFVAKCEITIEPKMNDWRYKVTYSLNGQELAEYEVNGLQSAPIWKPLNLISGVNIYPEGRSQYPFFYAMIQPLSSGAQGTYQCAVKSEYIPTYPSARSIYYSNKWNTNTSLQTFIPSANVKYTTTAWSDGQNSIGTYTYTAQCGLSLTPNTGNYNVTFRIGRLVLGEYVVKQEQQPIYYSTVIWHTRNILPGINLFPKYESASYPNFEVITSVNRYQLRNHQTLTRAMQCSATMEVQKGGSATFFSDLYSRSESLELSTLLVIFIFICRHFI